MTTDLNSLRIDPALKSTSASPARPRRRWIAAGLIVIAIIAPLLLLRSPAALEVEVMRVAPPSPQQESAAAVVLNANGYVVAAHKIELAPKIVGRVLWVGVDMGDKVSKGDVLVKLEDDEYRARVLEQQGQRDAAQAKLDELRNGSRPEEVQKAQAELNQTTADLQNARLNVDRTRKLVGTNAVSEQAIDDAEARFNLAKAKMEAARAAFELVRLGPRQEQIAAQRATVEQSQGMLDLVQVDMTNTVIRAPINGTILERNVEVGEYVTTGFVGDRGAKGYVVSLADLNDLRVELDISQNDFPRVVLSQRCSITTDAYPDRKYDGIVDQIAPKANRQKATVQVKVKVLRPDDLLRPDMNASVAFHPPATSTAAAEGGVIVPASAVRSGNVFVVAGGRAVERPVRVGQAFTDGVRITAGLEAGETIIVNPPDALKPGRKVIGRAQAAGAS